ncbi:SLC41 divalent cation transporters, integral membrane domain [Ostreococcus tauri]|uniref:SLC41 divalent cation transporters, integral membrane domain n=1 Tax=Ostreococcus tauri TaxID=70448 RepID=A0A096P9B9_OSTTA|nr:SLC41 divalent cation transporters, integral membrane domain [Ostreococcus tauri]CEG00804.1 SLC41 divalent cation transporters, integral membrane domain [Ostreococcus tauri]|eukprot:XP_003084242.2 SLC41 divalent cation transporters, integral membrane domain [Ostreococcus tauri]
MRVAFELSRATTTAVSTSTVAHMRRSTARKALKRPSSLHTLSLTRRRARTTRETLARESASERSSEPSTSNAYDGSIARAETSTSSTSMEVQRALARRMLEAQRSWVSKSASTKDVDTDVEVVGVFTEAYTRVRWLLGLLILQSTSSFVLSGYEDLIKENIIVTLFLTMLVGAGGNAGNQSAIHVIRGLATGEMENTNECMRKTLVEQFQVGLMLGVVLSSAGFVRVLLTSPQGTDDLIGPFAIATALFAIVTTSTCVGTALPFLLMRLNQDPANAGTSVQVVMDVSGVIITCTVASFIFEHFV